MSTSDVDIFSGLGISGRVLWDGLVVSSHSPPSRVEFEIDLRMVVRLPGLDWVVGLGAVW